MMLSVLIASFANKYWKNLQLFLIICQSKISSKLKYEIAIKFKHVSLEYKIVIKN